MSDKSRLPTTTPGSALTSSTESTSLVSRGLADLEKEVQATSASMPTTKELQELQDRADKLLEDKSLPPHVRMKLARDRLLLASRIRLRMRYPKLGEAASSPGMSAEQFKQTSAQGQLATDKSRNQHVFDSAGNALIGPDDLLHAVARYAPEAERILEITVEEALRRTEQGDGGRFPMEPLVRCLKGTQPHPRAAYYAKFAAGEDGDIGSIHHGWCFDCFASLDGHEVNLLKALRFSDTTDGIVSAFFASVILPTIGAHWHGLYDRDYKLIGSTHDLNEAVFGDDLKGAVGDAQAILKIPLGLRIRRVDGSKSCKCLCLSETEGLLDIEFVLSADGQASEPVRTVLLEPEGRTFY